MTPTVTPEILTGAARAAHEVNRAYCITVGDLSQLPWDDAPEWQRESCLKGVQGVLDGNDPKDSHALWLAHKESEGWVYGPVKNVETKQHPCMLPYDQLPEWQRHKDMLFVSTVRTFLEAHGVTV